MNNHNSAFDIETRHINYREAGFDVRGLCFQDFIVLFREHGSKLDDLKSALPAGAGVEVDIAPQLDPAKLIAHFPEVIAHGLALAADAPGERANIARLPMPVMVEALLAVWDLTLAERDIESLVGEVVAAFQVVRATIGSTKRSLTTG